MNNHFENYQVSSILWTFTAKCAAKSPIMPLSRYTMISISEELRNNIKSSTNHIWNGLSNRNHVWHGVVAALRNNISQISYDY